MVGVVHGGVVCGDVVDVTVCYVDDGVVGVVVFDLVLVLLMVVDIWTV